METRIDNAFKTIVDNAIKVSENYTKKTSEHIDNIKTNVKDTAKNIYDYHSAIIKDGVIENIDLDAKINKYELENNYTKINISDNPYEKYKQLSSYKEKDGSYITYDRDGTILKYTDIQKSSDGSIIFYSDNILGKRIELKRIYKNCVTFKNEKYDINPSLVGADTYYNDGTFSSKNEFGSVTYTYTNGTKKENYLTDADIYQEYSTTGKGFRIYDKDGNVTTDVKDIAGKLEKIVTVYDSNGNNKTYLANYDNNTNTLTASKLLNDNNLSAMNEN